MCKPSLVYSNDFFVQPDRSRAKRRADPFILTLFSLSLNCLHLVGLSQGREVKTEEWKEKQKGVKEPDALG